MVVVLAVGLGYLRFAPEPTVQLPDDAQAGDLTLEKARGEWKLFHVTWHGRSD